MPRSTRVIKSTSAKRATLSLLGLFAATILDTTSQVDSHDEDRLPSDEKLSAQSPDELLTNSQSISAEEGDDNGGDDDGGLAFAEIIKQMKAGRMARLLQTRGMRIEIEKQLAKWKAHCLPIEAKSEALNVTIKEVDQSLEELQKTIADPIMDATAAAIKVKAGIEELKKLTLASLPNSNSSDQEIIDQVNLTLKSSLEKLVDQLIEEESYLDVSKLDNLFSDLEKSKAESSDGISEDALEIQEKESASSEIPSGIAAAA